MPFIALFTDFGWKGMHYVSQMVGVAYSINPNVTLIDGHHGINNYSIREAQYIIETSVDTFPRDTIIVVVVDPGVGSDRKILAIQRENGQILIGPDNGIFTPFILKERTKIFSVENSEYFHKGTDGQICTTFHGRDIMTPTAAHLSNGIALETVGPLMTKPVIVPPIAVEWENGRVIGHVQYIDEFGNIVTDISSLGFSELYEKPLSMNGIPIKLVSNFVEGEDQDILLLPGSSGHLEVVMNKKHAANHLEVKLDDEINILAVPINGTSEEILACFNLNDIEQFHTGKFINIFPYPRKIAHIKRIPHLISRIFVFTKDKKFLIQRRAFTRHSHPGKYTDSASGHVRYKKPFDFEHIQQEIIRELAEEMGSVTEYVEFMDLSMEKYVSSDDVELSYNFIGICSEQFSCDSVECEKESGFYTEQELRQLLETEEWVPFAMLYWNRILNDNMVDQILQRSEQSPAHLDGNKPPKITEINKIGAIIGRFQPFHKGHLSLIKEILRYVRKVKIGIGSSQYSNTTENPYDFETRKSFIETSLKDEDVDPSRYEVIPVPDIHNAELWGNHVISTLGDFDFFFSNSDWVRNLMVKEGKTVWKKLPFQMEKYNGTNIRKMIAEGKDISDYLPASVIKCLKEKERKVT